MTFPRRSQGTGSDADRIERRRFLRSVGAGLALSPFVGQSAQPTLELGGEMSGWQGREPDSIRGETNPTLELDPGTSYVIAWENLDGQPHNVVIENEAGDRVVESPLVDERGAIQRVEFTAEAGMATYYCEAHPSSMRGDVTTDDETVTSAEPTPYPDQNAIPAGPEVHLEPVAEGLVSPMAMKSIPGDSDHRVIADQVGLLRYHGDEVRDEPFLDIRDRMVSVGEGTWSEYDERGLLGVAFHPSFADNRRFYVRYSAPPRSDGYTEYGHTAVIAEFEATGDGTRGRPDSERIVLEEPMPGPVHNGGALAFGPDGYLYAGLADGSNTNDAGTGHAEDWYEANPGGNGQDVTSSLLGGIVRIDVDDRTGDEPYGVPDDNPLVGREGRDEYFAWGFRNPWRMSFDSSGRLFVGDPGGQLYEEVNVVERGGNYGWNVREGTSCFNAENQNAPFEDCPDSTPENVRGGEPLLDPVLTYPHWDHAGVPVGIAVIGGYLYESTTVSALTDAYVFGDFSRSYEQPAGSLFAATPPGNGSDEWTQRKLVVENTDDGELGRYLLAFGRDSDGELYVLSNRTGAPNGNSGTVHRIEPARSPASRETAETDASGSNAADTEPSLPEGSMYVLISALAGISLTALYRHSRRNSDDELE